ncbi:hypothetical protein [Streptomyces sp. NPDC058739]|uniref:Rv1733c family protein n=1 Tax=Streptomyces sp. NPDC058739 TaxID=3346618 RepID=UPI0036A317C1
MRLRGRRVGHVRLWRWRRSPLRRRSDVVEGWVLLVAWTLAVLCGVLAGLTVAGSVERGLARERAEWRPVTARLTERAPGVPPGPGAASGSQVWAGIGWRAPDGSPRSGQARVGPGTAAGTAVKVWTDRQGRLVGEPVGAAEARVRSALVGTLMGLGAAMVPFACGRAVRDRLECRRLDQWETDWLRFDPLWGHRTGSGPHDA